MKRIVRITARAGALGVLILSLLTLSSFAVSARVYADSPLPHMGQRLAAAYLAHTANGAAQLNWSPTTDALTVTLNVSGLQATTVHPAHIHTGNCAVDGAIIYPLNNVVADAAGNAVSTTVISNIKGGIPATGWYIDVHVGPTLATAEQAASVACGAVVNSNTSIASAQSVTTTLSITPSPNQSAYGVSLLTLRGQTLTVYTIVYHLVPGSMHAAHIHAGSCQYQSPGDILYPLTTLTANAKGFATSTTVISGITAIPSTGWYVNIHYGTDLSTQVGFDPIDCGNVNLLY